MFETPFWLWLILLLPLAAFVVQIFAGRKLPRQGDWVSIAAIGIGAVISLVMFLHMLSLGKADFSIVWRFEWVALGTDAAHPAFALPLGFLLDNITIIMLLVVTSISTLVHVFSTGYMHDDPRYSRFFAYLSLFSFSMLWLVLADNLFGLFIGWELVGLSSYLLIGFWFEKPSAAAACKKAFITNRVGDFGMLVGILMILSVTLPMVQDSATLAPVDQNPLSYSNLFDAVAQGRFQTAAWPDWMPVSYLTAAGILLFLGAVGKSAQFPLHVWLPDAMEGPTPVSALIHAATMVAAGVYMITRCYRFFSPDALLVIAYTGGFTAIFAATIAVTANDIKKVLAYSTVSQLGYMVLGLGCIGYSAGFFHLWTHAFFKALLFLGSGSVIHALHTQDIREMGGLRKKLPITFITMLIATCAITGFPPFLFSGFWSKDQVLGSALAFAMEHRRHWLLPVFGFCGAALTAFYMFRMMFMTFWGEPRDHHKYEHAHPEHWNALNAPLAVLAFATLVSAGIGGTWFEKYVSPGEVARRSVNVTHEGRTENAQLETDLHPLVAIANASAEEREHHQHTEHTAHGMAMLLSILIATSGVLVSAFTYWKPVISAEAWSKRLAWLYSALVNKWWIDELMERFIIGPCLALNDFLASFDLEFVDAIVNGAASFTVHFADYSGWVDNEYVDGMVNGTADAVVNSGRAMRSMQSGNIKQYVAATVIGLTVVVILLNLL